MSVLTNAAHELLARVIQTAEVANSRYGMQRLVHIVAGRPVLPLRFRYIHYAN